ncbi:site-2 protease family protein [Candidatus Uhrbacteria bacterium]|nr:site-2 protease family protein [Candidatus Uhrbacteria bacterium]
MDQSSIIAIIVSVAAIFLAITVHEFSHGLMAYIQGDKTAYDSGRLTLNPIAHIDPIGTILIPGLLILSGSPFLIGWAKPVPFNPHNLRSGRFGSFLVGLAGPLSNFIIAIIAAIALKALFPALGVTNFLIIFLAQLFFINIVLGTFNLIPVPPLDGSKILFNLLPPRFDRIAEWLELYGFYILIGILFFGQGVIGSIVHAVVGVFAGAFDLPLY